MPDCAALLATAQASEITLQAAEEDYSAAYVANIDAWMTYFSQCMMGMAATEPEAEKAVVTLGRQTAREILDSLPEAFRKMWPELPRDDKARFINGWCER